MNQTSQSSSADLPQSQTSRQGFTHDEDKLLQDIVSNFGNKCIDWEQVASCFPNHTSRQCRERWTKHLNPKQDYKITQNDGQNIETMYAKHGPKWEVIASSIYGDKKFASSVQRRWKTSQRSGSVKKFDMPISQDSNAPWRSSLDRNDEEADDGRSQDLESILPTENDSSRELDDILPNVYDDSSVRPDDFCALEPSYIQSTQSTQSAKLVNFSLQEDENWPQKISFGLPNLGSTCFFSSVIQMIRSNPSLMTFFIELRNNENLTIQQKDFLEALTPILMADLQNYQSNLEAILKYVKLSLHQQHDPAELMNKLADFFPDIPIFGKQLFIVPVNQDGTSVAAENWTDIWPNAFGYKLKIQPTKIINVLIHEHNNYFTDDFNAFQKSVPWLTAPDVFIVKQYSNSGPSQFQGLSFPTQLDTWSQPCLKDNKGKIIYTSDDITPKDDERTDASSKATSEDEKGKAICIPNGTILNFQTRNEYILNGGIATKRGRQNSGHYIAFVYNKDDASVTIYNDDKEIDIPESQLSEWLRQNNFQPYIGCYSKTNEVNVDEEMPIASMER